MSKKKKKNIIIYRAGYRAYYIVCIRFCIARYLYVVERWKEGQIQVLNEKSQQSIQHDCCT